MILLFSHLSIPFRKKVGFFFDGALWYHEKVYGECHGKAGVNICGRAVNSAAKIDSTGAVTRFRKDTIYET
jgi:hypothetical protein